MATGLLRKIVRFLIRLLISTLLVSTFFVLIQDFLLFPVLWNRPLRWMVAPAESSGTTTRHLISTPDGPRVELFEQQPNDRKKIASAILFHGNGEPATLMTGVQKWLAGFGVASYAFEYRGMGHSEGWPSEAGIDADAAAAWDFVNERERLPASKMIVIGQSIGTGFAAALAAAKKPGTLLLISPYTSLRERAAEEPLLGVLASRFLKYNVPTREYVAQLPGESCLIIAHGELDSVIPFKHAGQVIQAFHGRQVFEIYSKTAGHNDILRLEQKQIAQSIVECVKSAPEL